MKQFSRALLSATLLLASAAVFTPNALAYPITFVTRGVAKVGGLVIGSTQLTSTATELNTLHGVTATGTEVNTLADEVASAAVVATPASGSCAAQFTFKNAAGSAVTGVRSLIAYLSNSGGAQVGGQTSLVALTNGQTTQLVTGKTILATSTAAGLWGVTLTASAGNYYLTFCLPNGKTLVSDVLTVN